MKFKKITIKEITDAWVTAIKDFNKSKDECVTLIEFTNGSSIKTVNTNKASARGNRSKILLISDKPVAITKKGNSVFYKNKFNLKGEEQKCGN